MEMTKSQATAQRIM